jgi:hypothetical protein
MGGRMDCGCIGLTVYCRDLPGATAYAAEAPIASTQGGVGKLTTAAGASAIANSDLRNRTSPIEHPYDRSRPRDQPTQAVETIADRLGSTPQTIESNSTFSFDLISTESTFWVNTRS